MDDLGWALVGVVVLCVACAIAGWTAFELQNPPDLPPSPPASTDVERYYAAAYPVVCALPSPPETAGSGVVRVDPAGVDPKLYAVNVHVAHDATVDAGVLRFFAPPGATAATAQVPGIGELRLRWAAGSVVGPEAEPVACASVAPVASMAQITGKVADPRGSRVTADCAFAAAPVEDDAWFVLDVPVGRPCTVQLRDAAGGAVGASRLVVADGDVTLDLGGRAVSPPR
jgi:hypothetical protein